MKRILVVCTANICRSPMVAALLRARLQAAGLADAVEVASAGVYALGGEPADPIMERLLATTGVSVGPHRAQGIAVPALREADLILVAEERHRQAIFHHDPRSLHKVLLITELNRSYGDLPDPYGQAEERYREVLTRALRVLDEGWENLLQRLALAPS